MIMSVCLCGPTASPTWPRRVRLLRWLTLEERSRWSTAVPPTGAWQMLPMGVIAKEADGDSPAEPCAETLADQPMPANAARTRARNRPYGLHMLKPTDHFLRFMGAQLLAKEMLVAACAAGQHTVDSKAFAVGVVVVQLVVKPAVHRLVALRDKAERTRSRHVAASTGAVAKIVEQSGQHYDAVFDVSSDDDSDSDSGNGNGNSSEVAANWRRTRITVLEDAAAARRSLIARLEATAARLEETVCPRPGSVSGQRRPFDSPVCLQRVLRPWTFSKRSVPLADACCGSRWRTLVRPAASAGFPC